jgi:hypothetical protein
LRISVPQDPRPLDLTSYKRKFQYGIYCITNAQKNKNKGNNKKENSNKAFTVPALLKINKGLYLFINKDLFFYSRSQSSSA